MAASPTGAIPRSAPASNRLSHTDTARSAGTCSSNPSSPTYVTRRASTRAYPTSSRRAARYGQRGVRHVVRREPREQLARARALHRQQRGAGGDVRDDGLLAVPPGPPQHRRDPAVRHVAAHDQQLVVGEPGHGDVGEDAAAVVEPLGVDDPSDVARDGPGAHPVEQRGGVPALHEERRHECSCPGRRPPPGRRGARRRRTRASAGGPTTGSPRRRPGRLPGGANHSGYSQPAETPNRAPAAASRSCSGVRRTPRADAGCHAGKAASPNSAPSCSTVRSARNRRVVSCGSARSTP